MMKYEQFKGVKSKNEVAGIDQVEAEIGRNCMLITPNFNCHTLNNAWPFDCCYFSLAKVKDCTDFLKFFAFSNFHVYSPRVATTERRRKLDGSFISSDHTTTQGCHNFASKSGLKSRQITNPT